MALPAGRMLSRPERAGDGSRSVQWGWVDGGEAVVLHGSVAVTAYMPWLRGRLHDALSETKGKRERAVRLVGSWLRSRFRRLECLPVEYRGLPATPRQWEVLTAHRKASEAEILAYWTAEQLLGRTPTVEWRAVLGGRTAPEDRLRAGVVLLDRPSGDWLFLLDLDGGRLEVHNGTRGRAAGPGRLPGLRLVAVAGLGEVERPLDNIIGPSWR
jgi:hypothetical protein